AVVAEEVKQLADQTSQATEKIRQRIEAVRQAAGAIERITETIVEVDRAQQSIADSVQAQSANAHAMTGSVDAVTAGAQAMADAGVDVTLCATLDSGTAAKVDGVCPRPYGEDPALDGRVWEGLHIAHCLRRSGEFDLVHNNLDWLPLAMSDFCRAPMVTTIHG